MQRVKKFVESRGFQNFILAVIVLNAAVMGIQTAKSLPGGVRLFLSGVDAVCLWIFVGELVLKLTVYRLRFFKDGWNLFDLLVVLLSIFSDLSFFSVFRVFRIFRVMRSLKALKSLRGFRLVSGLKELRMIVEAIGRSIPGIFWSGVLLMLVYYIFAIMGTTLFGEGFPQWFGSIGDSFYTLFQVMTLESWSMGISRPVMEMFPWAWAYFVPFVLCTSFLIMNVVVGIVVNAISEVSEEQGHTEKSDGLREELEALSSQLAHVQELLRQREREDG